MFSLINKIIIALASLVVVIFIILLVTQTQLMGPDKLEKISNVAQSKATAIESYLVSLQDIPDYISFPLGNTVFREEDLKDILRLIVKNNPEIYGSTCAFEPYKFYPDSVYFAPYFFKDNDSVCCKSLAGSDYNYFSWNWYLIPKKLGKAFWTEPYFDDGGGSINLITYSAPIIKYNDDNDNEFLGVVTVDMTLDWLNKIVGTIDAPGGFAVLVSKMGTVISSDRKNKQWRLKQTIFTLAEEFKWNFREIGKKAIKGLKGTGKFTDNNGNKFIVTYLPIKKSDWSLLIAVSDN